MSETPVAIINQLLAAVTAAPPPDPNRRFRITVGGLTVEELAPDGSRKPFMSTDGLTYEGPYATVVGVQAAVLETVRLLTALGAARLVDPSGRGPNK